MKITDLNPKVVSSGMRNWVFVKVETDVPGLYGWGEATQEWKTRSVVGAVEDLAPLVIGLDPRDIENASRILNKWGVWRIGVIGTSAISGIEMALWGIMGKSLDVPVWCLLGGKIREKVRVYTHVGIGEMKSVYESFNKGSLIERAHAVIERGYTAVKLINIPYTYYTASIRDLKKLDTGILGTARSGRR